MKKILVHLFTPEEDKESILELESSKFRIINYYYKNEDGRQLWLIEMSEDDMTFLSLKYGTENVWERQDS